MSQLRGVVAAEAATVIVAKLIKILQSTNVIY